MAKGLRVDNTEVKKGHRAAQLAGQRRSSWAVKRVMVFVEPNGIVKEGEQENECRVGVGYLRKEGEPGRGDPLPVALAVYGRILACGSL